MGIATTDDGVELYYESTGLGTAIIFVHEYAGDLRSWENQVRHFSRRYRCVTFNARGYSPSAVPADNAAYSQARATRDIIAVMDHLDIRQAHIVGLSMGGFATLHLGLSAPERALSLCVAGVGYGAESDQRSLFRREAEAAAHYVEQHGIQAFADRYSLGPTRLPFRDADPRGFAEFQAQLAEHDPVGAAYTQLGEQRERPSLYEMQEALSRMRTPTLIMSGDEDWPCLAPSLMLKRTMPASALAILPHCGHTINLEHPATFNHLLEDFFAGVASGRWPMRDPAATVAAITGMADTPTAPSHHP